MPSAPLPTHIGPYTITGKIGSGGMATVYRATQPSDGREVALKVLNIHLADQPEMRTRFEREAHMLIQFKHPHILPVYDYGHDGNTPYFVMKLLGGRTLAAMLHGKPLPIEQVGRYTRQIASALDYAHARGIVHRDIKPANILFDQDGMLYLADFGVAYWTETTPGARLTRAGAFVGTAAYASPEQCRGEPLDRPSDIYSLAVLVFQMSAGRLPFEATSPFAVMKLHLREAPPNPLSFNPFLPIALYQVLVKALAKLPQNRYPSAMKFSEAVDRALGLHTLIEPTADDDDNWLYDAILPVMPDGPAVSDAPAETSASDELPALVDPFGFDSGGDYGPDDPFRDVEGGAAQQIEAVVGRFDDAAFDDQFDSSQFDLALNNHNVRLADDFSDEVQIGTPDASPPVDMFRNVSTAAPTSSVIRPLREPPPPRAAAKHREERLPMRIYLFSLLVVLVTAAIVAYAIQRQGTPAETTANYRSEALRVTLEHPANWYVTPVYMGVLSSTSTATVLISDRPVSPDRYAGAALVIAVQRIDPVEVFGVPEGCEDHIVGGPAYTFECMTVQGFATPVYRPFATPYYFNSVRLPGTLPPKRASLPTVLISTGQMQWLALVIVHWDGYNGAQDRLGQIAQSVRPL
jgi:serine/threonine protein kinase